MKIITCNDCHGVGCLQCNKRGQITVEQHFDKMPKWFRQIMESKAKYKKRDDGYDDETGEGY